MPPHVHYRSTRMYSILQKSVSKSRFLENAIDSRMRIKTITYGDVLTKALPVLLARTFAHHYSILQKSVSKSRFLENAIDSRMRIKTITYGDVLTKDRYAQLS